MFLRHFFLVLAVLAVTALSAHAQNVTYDFKDPKGVNSIAILLDSKLEPSVGFASQISGSIKIDPVSREIKEGEIRLPATGIIMSNEAMTRVLHSSEWLHTEKYPDVVFQFLRVVSVSSATADRHEMTVEGDLTVKGVTRKITVPVSVTFLPGQLKMRNPKDEGDLLILRAFFHISRKDFNIKPDVPAAIVADKIQLHVNVAARAGIY